MITLLKWISSLTMLGKGGNIIISLSPWREGPKGDNYIRLICLHLNLYFNIEMKQDQSNVVSVPWFTGFRGHNLFLLREITNNCFYLFHVLLKYFADWNAIKWAVIYMGARGIDFPLFLWLFKFYFWSVWFRDTNVFICLMFYWNILQIERPTSH